MSWGSVSLQLSGPEEQEDSPVEEELGAPTKLGKTKTGILPFSVLSVHSLGRVLATGEVEGSSLPKD